MFDFFLSYFLFCDLGMFRVNCYIIWPSQSSDFLHRSSDLEYFHHDLEELELIFLDDWHVFPLQVCICQSIFTRGLSS